MATWTDLPLPDGSYSDDTRPWTSQDVVNLLPTFAEAAGTRSRMKFTPTPGLEPFAIAGEGGHRGGRDVEGKCFVVAGNKLYRITPTGVSIPLGTIPGTGLVSMTHNQIEGGNELVIGTRDNSYVWNTVTETLTATGVALSSVDFLNQRIIGIEPQRRFFRYSAHADATSYNDLDVESAESSPDRIVGSIVSNGEVLVFGERTIEPWSNTPNASTAFQRLTGQIQEKGCINANTICRLDNSVMFVGNDFIPYRYSGGAPIPIGTKAIVGDLSQRDPTKLLSYTWEDRGYVVYYITAQDGLTWGYDVTSRKWHRKESPGLQRWRLNTLFKWRNEWYGGDYANGTLHRLKWGYPYDGQELFERRIRSGVLHADGKRVMVHGMKVLAETGLGPVNASPVPIQPAGPTITGNAPDGLIAAAYPGFAYTVTPGDTPIAAVTVQSGSFPPGLTMDNSGVIDTGPATEIGDYAFAVRARDANGLFAEQPDTIEIATIQYATTGSTLLSFTQLPYDWSNTVNVGASVAGKLVESRAAKVFAFHASDAGASVSSDIGQTWTACTGLPSARIVSLVYASNKWIAVAAAGTSVYTSTDGIAFSALSYASDDQLTTAAFAEGTTVMVGRSNSAQSRVSRDGGATWGDMPLISAVQIWAFASSGDSIVACTNADLRRSTNDGVSWTSVGDPFGTGNLASVAYGNDQYLCVSGPGNVARSLDDGVTWDVLANLPESMGGVGQGNEMIFDGANFVVAGVVHVYSSPDGVAWTERTALSASAIAFYRTGQ